MKIKLQDLPPSLRKQVEDKIRAEDALRTPLLPPPPDLTPSTPTRKAKEPTKTELRYRLEILDRNPAVSGIAFEGITLRMANGHRYTPDWTFWVGGRLHCVEVKGSYRLGSYQRACLAFDQAAVEWPMITWIWAEWTGAQWNTSRKMTNTDTEDTNA